MTWYYVKNGEAAGPITDEEFLSKLHIGSILPTTLVWRSGMAEWESASKASAQIVSPVVAPSAQPLDPIASPGSMAEFAAGEPPVLPHFFCTFCGNIIPADQLIRISGRAVCGVCKPLYVQQAREGLNAPLKAPIIPGALPAGAESDLADPAIRLVAHILDLVFLAVPMFIGYVLVFVVGISAAAATTQKNAPTVMFPAFMVVFSIFIALATVGTLAYWTLFLGGRGATPGMKIMKVKMVRSNRGPLGYGRAFGRTLLLYVINVFTMSLTNISAFFDRERRTVVDMICDTRVVRS